MINYHPNIETLTDFTSGALPLTHCMLIATHLEHCTECQQQVRKLSLLGACIFDQIKTENGPIDKLKQSFFSQLSVLNTQNNMPSKTQIGFTAPWKLNYQVPSSLHQFVPAGYDKLKWIHLSPSIKISVLCCEDGGEQVALVRIKAGASIPTHTHTGEEATLVLEGAFFDESGGYHRGDFINRDASHKHKPVVTEDTECICLTVLDSPIEFTGWFTRLFNPIMRFHHPNASR